MSTFDEELKAFNEHREGLVHVLGDGTGWHALVKGATIWGVYPTMDLCYRAGVERFGLDIFMCKEIQTKDPMIRFCGSSLQDLGEAVFAGYKDRHTLIIDNHQVENTL